jgi:hypothetical protein
MVWIFDRSYPAMSPALASKVRPGLFLALYQGFMNV